MNKQQTRLFVYISTIVIGLLLSLVSVTFFMGALKKIGLFIGYILALIGLVFLFVRWRK